MVEQTQNVNLKSVAWNEQAAILLQGAAGVDPTYTLDDLRREVIEGHATLYLVSLGADALGYVVLWVDDFGRTRELVIQAGEAFRNHKSAARLTLPALENFARSRGCASMRTHVAGGSRFIGSLRDAGFRKTEVVFKKGVV
ncbi:hypothetical protein [Magnetovibrio blakemorei]|uniref:N-acetyltransferase domain-containing protein n=1 Tax=Magnetovibrio blakemorei TaxID=28181 RepID=A0A1E5Q4J7_9PROT|nr:hypothetical protein [Magnetovibrio blakemorei]OEJ64651.1 hypothetical protein BEN30_00740 [Magnetovibrio blakemorei]